VQAQAVYGYRALEIDMLPVLALLGIAQMGFGSLS